MHCDLSDSLYYHSSLHAGQICPRLSSEQIQMSGFTTKSHSVILEVKWNRSPTGMTMTTICMCAHLHKCARASNFFFNHIPKEFIKSYVGECVMMSMCLCPVKLTSSMCVCVCTHRYVGLRVCNEGTLLTWPLKWSQHDSVIFSLLLIPVQLEPTKFRVHLHPSFSHSCTRVLDLLSLHHFWHILSTFKQPLCPFLSAIFPPLSLFNFSLWPLNPIFKVWINQ